MLIKIENVDDLEKIIAHLDRAERAGNPSTFDTIIKKYDLPESVIDKFYKCFKKKLIFKYQNVSMKFLMRHRLGVPWGAYLSRHDLSTARIISILRAAENNKIPVSFNDITNFISEHVLPVEVIEQYKEYLNWDKLSVSQPIETLLLFKRKVKWNIVNLSIDSLRQYKDKLNWNYFTSKLTTLDLLTEFKDYVIWSRVNLQNIKLSEDILMEHFDSFRIDYLIKYQDLSEAVLERHINKFDNYKCIMSQYQKLSENFMRRHIDKVDLPTVSTYQDVSEDFREEFDLI